MADQYFKIIESVEFYFKIIRMVIESDRYGGII